ncbi:hypothetical protein BJ508DRAFT_214093 [Ascobolus immersus RN42]|uniref:NYN domain-containing protein n=1 Tax=Ascobolus immersus RN42 TaxID=1160509 RepID=A0A3N4HVK4_ASCIM|nr:hypothetical protein BJ508DRAFT_214093 [Ascobolus immersus RN42]
MGESPKVKVKKTVPLTKSFSGNERPVQSRKGTDSTKGSVTVKGNLKLYSLPEQKKKIVSLLPGQERKQIVLQSLLKKFPADESTLRSPYHPSRPFASSEPGIHIFIDNSNIIIGFYQALKRVFSLSENTPTYRPNFDFHTFSFILERGRRTSTKCLVGSLPSTAAIVEAENLGYTTNLLTRVEKQQAPVTKPGSPKSAGKKLPNDSPKKTEQAVDEIISLKMALTLLDNADCPSTLVLASGDAAQGEFSDGFRSVVERFLKAGWKVEVMSFRNCLGNGYRQKEWGERWGDRFRVVELDGYVEAFLADEDVMGV